LETFPLASPLDETAEGILLMQTSLETLVEALNSSPFDVYRQMGKKVQEVIEDNKRLIRTNADLSKELQEFKTKEALDVLFPAQTVKPELQYANQYLAETEQQQVAVEGWDFP